MTKFIKPIYASLYWHNVEIKPPYDEGIKRGKHQVGNDEG